MAEAITWIQGFVMESAVGLIQTVAILVAIIVPLMIGVELLREGHVMDRISKASEPVVRWLGLSGHATVPLMAGLFFGLSYGAGVILESAREGELSARDCRLLTIFLVACHAVVEDTLLFVPFGVNPLILAGSRLLLAIALTFAAARIMNWTARGSRMAGV